tara:strand:- start:553 stop:735 length:183 start_codon:yes stop_codon:yes gene_type:complete
MDTNDLKDISNWEKEYLNMDVKLSKREREILEGAELKTNEGMLFGRMYNDWKRRRGFDWV